MKLNVQFVDIVNQALKIVKWFNNHSRALGLLADQQKFRYGNVLTFILSVLTHWTSHYLSATHLLEIEQALQVLVAESQDTLIAIVGVRADAI